MAEEETSFGASARVLAAKATVVCLVGWLLWREAESAKEEEEEENGIWREASSRADKGGLRIKGREGS